MFRARFDGLEASPGLGGIRNAGNRSYIRALIAPILSKLPLKHLQTPLRPYDVCLPRLLQRHTVYEELYKLRSSMSNENMKRISG